MEKQTKSKLLFAAFFMGPSVALYALSYVDSAPLLGTLSAALTLAAVTLFPLVGALYFDRNKSICLSLLIPLVLTLSKALNFDGAERLVVVGFLVFLVSSTLSWVLGRLIKYLYRKYYLKVI